MAGQDITNDIGAYAGVLIPYRQCSPSGFWDDESSFSQASPVAGDPDPDAPSALDLRAVGSQSGGAEVEVLLQRGGHPVRENGAGFVFKDSEDSDYLGGDPVRVIYGWEPIEWSSTSPGARHPHMRTSPTTGTAVVAYQLRDGVLNKLMVRRKPRGGVWNNAIEVFSVASASVDHSLHPCVMVRPDGSFFVYHWVEEDGSTQAQIRAHCSTDDGSSFSVGERFVLDESVDIDGAPGSGATGFDLGRIRAAYADGQALLIASISAHDTDLIATGTRARLVQYASDSEGLRYEQVFIDTESTGNSFGAHEIVAVDGVFRMVYIGGHSASVGSPESIYQTVFESAFKAINETSPSLISTGYDHADYDGASGLYDLSELAAWSDENGVLYCVMARITGSGHQGATGIIRSRDRGNTWEAMGDSSQGSAAFGMWHKGDTSNYLVELCGSSHEGRAIVISSWESTTGTYDPSIAAFYLGGYSSVTMPGQTLFELDIDRAGWELNYLAFESPSSLGWSVSVTGTPTRGIASLGGGYAITTTGESVNVSKTFPGTVEGGVVARAAFDVSFGGSAGSSSTCSSGLKIRLADGTDDKRIEIHASTGAFSVHDPSITSGSNEVGSSVGSLDLTEGIEFKVGLNNGTVSVWYRSYTADDHAKTWILSHDSLTIGNNSSPQATNLIEFGNPDSGTATSKWYEVHLVSDDGVTTGKYIGPNGLADGQSNPDDLFPVDLTSQPRYLDDGLSVFGVDGPAKRGDLFSISARSDFSVERMFPIIEPTPRRGWRSIGIAAQSFAFALNDETGAPGIEDCDPGSDLLGVYFGDVNFRTGRIEGYEAGTGWVTVTQFDLAQGLTDLRWTRAGNRVVPDLVSSGPLDPLYLFAGEYTGRGYFELDGDGPFPIGRHGPGVFGATQGLYPRISISGTTPATGTTGTAGVIRPANAVVLFSPKGVDYAGFRVVVDSQATYEGYLKCGVLALGVVLVSSPTFSHGWRRSREPGFVVEESRDRTAHARVVAPYRDSFAFGWPESVYDGDVRHGPDGPPNPDYLFASTAPGSEAVAAFGDAPYSIEGVVPFLEESLTPIVCIPEIASWNPPMTSLIMNRGGSHFYGWFDQVVDIDHVFGLPGEGKNLLRVARITVRGQP